MLPSLMLHSKDLQCNIIMYIERQDSDSYVESVTVEISGIEAHQEYTVRCDLPASVRNGYTVYYTSAYTEVYGDGLN